MTAKDWLNRGWKINQEIEALNRTKLSLFARITSITAPLDREPVSSSSNPHQMDAYVEYCDKVDQRARDLMEVSREILTMIGQIKDGRYRTILISRYIGFLTWEQIAADMRYSRRQVTRLHGDALMAAKDVLECHIDTVLDCKMEKEK